MKLKQFIFAFTAMLLCFTVSVNAQVAKIGGTEYTTLADALDAAKAKTGDVTVELYEKVTLNQPLNGSFTTITFVGKDTDAEIYLDVQGYITATGKKVSFTDLKLSKSEGGFITNAGFMNVAFGVYDVAEVTYTNCTFANGAYASSGKVTYDGCTFKKSWDKYGLWAYGNVDVTVQGSTFADYRGIKMYAENGADASVEKANLTVKNTNFSAVDNKPAIVLTYGESVVLEGNTYSSTGTFELDLDGKPNGVAVTSDVAPVCVNDNGACGVLVDGKIYTTVAQAAEVATAGSTVTLLHNSTETVKFPEGVTLNKNGFTANGVTVVAVAKIGDVEYATLQAALDAAAAGTGNVTVTILADVDLTGVDWNPVTVSAPGYPVVTVEGNGKTITDLNDMLFAGTWAGKSGLIIKNLTIANSAIVNDKDDAKGTVGVGAFIGYPQASATITLENCHLKNSSVEGGHWTGGLIGMAGGYNGADGPVFMNLTIKGCSVTGSTITGKGSVGGVIGHGSCAAWTNVVIEKTTVSDNTITSTGSSNVKAGAVMGTIGAAGQPTTVNGVTNTGGMSVSATVAENTVKSNGTKITTIYGRQGTETGMLYVAGGSYDNYPIEEGVAYAAPAKGYKIEKNTDGTYGVVVDPAYGKVAKIGNKYYATFEEAFAAVQAGETLTLLTDLNLSDILTINKSITLDGNGKTLTSTAGRAINIETEGKVVINNLTVNAAERAFNIINKAATVELDGVTATAKNNAVMVATSAGAAKVTINDCDFTGLAVVNVAGAKSVVAIKNSKITNVDTNPAENYGAITVWTSAEEAVVNVENTTITVADDSKKAYVFPADATVNGVDEVSYIVATVGDAGYETLEAALAAKGNEVVELLVPYVVAKGETVTLDLNGKTVTGTPSEAKAYAVITNYGTLTISNGSVICNHTLAGSTGYAVNTITNCGTLTIEDATIENKSTAQYQIGYAIDNNSTSADAVVNIKGGKVIASGSLYYDGIRQFCNSQTKENSIVVSGGEVSTIWMQNPSDGATKNTKDVKGSIAISGGKVDVLSLEPSANFEAAVTGGHFGEISYFQTAEGRDLKGFITGGTFDKLIDETFLAMGYQLTGDAAPYTVAYTGKVTKLELVDGEFTEFVNEKEVTVDTLTYKRNVLKTWVPIYVPFEIPVSMLAEKFYVARINDVRRTDNNNDGELDDFDMEIIFIHGGNADGSGKTLKANYPYFIKSKSGKTETMEITLTGATLYAAKENVFDCTTMTEKFEIKGNCRLMQANEFDPKNQYTVLTTGEWGHTTSALKPFRFYMTKSSRYEDEPAAPMNSMRITVRGEEDENGATIIYDVVEDSLNNNGNAFIYDLQGRRVSEPKKGGIYIKNGKKILF